MALSRVFAIVLVTLLGISSANVDAPAPHQSTGAYMTVVVEPRTEECFYEDLEANSVFSMDFEVIKGGLLDIDFKIKNSVDQIVFQRLAFFNHKEDTKNDAEGHVKFSVGQPGTYALCFDNSLSRWTAKTISFFIPDIKGSKSQLAGPGHASEEMATLEHLSPFVESVVHLSDELDAVERVQHHMRVRESIHRDTAESTNSRVMWLSILESIILMTISVFQLFYIRQWFADSDKRRRV